MKERIYIVTNNVTGNMRLVRSATRQQAVAHVANATLIGEVASQDDLVKLVTSGVEVEQAGVYPDPEPIEIMGERAHVQPE
jgi:hypothetical protein